MGAAVCASGSAPPAAAAVCAEVGGAAAGPTLALAACHARKHEEHRICVAEVPKNPHPGSTHGPRWGSAGEASGAASGRTRAVSMATGVAAADGEVSGDRVEKKARGNSPERGEVHGEARGEAMGEARGETIGEARGETIGDETGDVNGEANGEMSMGLMGIGCVEVPSRKRRFPWQSTISCESWWPSDAVPRSQHARHRS